MSSPDLHPFPSSSGFPAYPGPVTAQAQAISLAPMTAWRPDPVRWALFALMMLTIGRFHQHFAVLSLIRPALLLTGAAIGFAVLAPGSLAGRDGLRTWPSKVIIALGAWSVATAFFGIGFGSSISFITGFYSKVLVFWVLLALVMRSGRDIRFFMWSYVLAAGFLVYLSIFVFDLSSFFDGSVNRLDNLYMYDSNDIGCIFAVAIPFALLLFQTSGRVGKVASGSILVGMAGATALAGSRGGFLGILVVGIALLLLARDLSWARRLAFVAVFGAGLAFFAPPGYWAQMGTMTHVEDDYNFTDTYGRVAIAKRGLGYLNAYPLFGVGAGNFMLAEGTISPVARNHEEGEQLMWVAPHNSFVQVGAEMGIPGLVMWASLIAGGVVAMIRMRRRIPRAWLHGNPDERFLYLATTYLAVALIGFGATAFFVSFAYQDVLPMLAAMMSGMYLALGPSAHRDPAAQPRGGAPPRWWARGAAGGEVRGRIG